MTRQRDTTDNGGLSPLTAQLLKILLPSALLLALLVTAFQYHSYALARENLSTSQTHSIAIATDGLHSDFETIMADLNTLAASHSLRRFASLPVAVNRTWAASELSALIRYKPLYASISYVAPNGELLLFVENPQHISQDHTIPQQLIDDLLAATKQAPAEQLAATPLILSADANGRPRPIVHFAGPMMDLTGGVRGALIVTYAPPRLLAHLDSVIKRQVDVDILINRRGDWLRHSDNTQGWVVADEAAFNEVYPNAWQYMLAADSGQFRADAGLFTFMTIYPEGRQPQGRAATASGETDPPQFWIVASHVSADVLTAVVAARFWHGMLIFALLLVPTALGCAYIARLIDGRRRNRERIRELGAAIDQTHDMVMITDADGNVRYVNPRFEAITGYGRNEIVGDKPSLLKSGAHEPAFYERLWDTIRRGKPFEASLINRKKDGQIFHVQMTISPLTGKRGITGFVATGKDITGQVSSQERLLKLAFHHPLTGLPNRALFRDHLQDAAARARRNEQSIAVLFIDLDRFKKVNDSLGHQAGDELLTGVAQRLRHAVREIDTVAHLGGDEFTVLLDAIQQPAQVRAIVSKLLQLFEQPFTVVGRDLYVGASIGIALFPQDSDSVELVVEQADTAMYQAKRAGLNQFQFYSAEMTTLANERLDLEDRLRTALLRKEFELHFQPIVDPLRRELRGLEALVRWRQPDGTLRAPDEFIPVLEETGLIVPATEWVLEEACRQYLHLYVSGMKRLRISVNISARSFAQDNLVKTVADVLEKTGMPATQLVLEVTESILLEDQHSVQNTLEQLRSLGVAIAIDDFGTGYSSLSYLRRLPVDIIKIDRSFINGVGPNSRDAALVSAMMAMAQELQLDVVAEGVEKTHQLDFLRQRNCDGAQGFLFSAALPADDISAQLDRDQHWPWKSWMDRGHVQRLH